MPAKIFTAFLCCLMLCFVSGAQNNTPACSDLKNGIFYNYPKNKTDQYVDNRTGEWVHETNLVAGDTSLWQIKWTGECTYTLKYISGNQKWDKQVFEFLKKHVFAIEITKVTMDYYVFKSYVDKISSIPVLADTMWFSQKFNIVHTRLIERLPNSMVLRKNHFSDTSKYAVIYLYRPGKISNGLASYPVYLNDDIICVAENNTGFIFKIFKEGPFTFGSRLFKDESSVTVDLNFGKTYYIKSMIHWTISSRLYNFKLETAIVDPDKGQKEFDEVNLR